MYVMGDCHQLPPVGMKALFDPREPSGDPSHACGIGKVAFELFRDPPDDEEERAVTVVMDETMRQKDPTFKRVIQEMRDGNVSDATVEVLQGRRLNKLPQAERETFEREALQSHFVFAKPSQFTNPKGPQLGKTTCGNILWYVCLLRTHRSTGHLVWLKLAARVLQN